MPLYSFTCNDCFFGFDELLSIDNRKNPINCGCPSCGNKSIVSKINTIAIFSDTTLTANSKTKGDWNKLMSKMKKGTPKHLHENLDQASSRTGRRTLG